MRIKSQKSYNVQNEMLIAAGKEPDLVLWERRTYQCHQHKKLLWPNPGLIPAAIPFLHKRGQE